MKKKVIGILVVTLLIGTAIPAYGTINLGDSDFEIKPTLSPGDYLRFMLFDMRIRSYRIHVPPSYDDTNPIPLVIAFHGYSANSMNFMAYTELNEKADEEEFIVIYPNGGTDLSFLLYCLKNNGIWGFYWNSWESYDINDVGFSRKIINTVQSEYNINENRIYATGWSNGGFMSYRIGAELSDIIAAIAPVSGSIGGVWDYWYGIDSPLYIIPEPEKPVSVIVFHGMNDIAVPYEGIRNPLTDEIILYSVNESVALWVEHNNCDSIPQINIGESENIITRTYANGSQGTEVVLYTVVDGVHEWFGSSYSPCEISCNELMWDFFEAHPK